MSEASKEATWIINFIGDLGVVPSNKDLLEILCDKEGTLALTKEPKDHRRSRHIKRIYHYIQDWDEDGDLVMKRVSSEENATDLFIKRDDQGKT